MTEKRFTIDFENRVITDNTTTEVYSTLIQFKELLNILNDENEELKKENGRWKSIAYTNSSFNSILLNELDIAKEQGYAVSDPFKKLLGECEYD